MADLPMLDQRRVRDQVPGPEYGQVSENPEAFGAGLARSFDSASDTFAEIAHRERQKADAFAAADLDNKFAEAANELVYNGQTGFVAKQGAAALDTAPVKQELLKLREKIGRSATSDDQLRAFRARTGDKLEKLDRQIETHSGQQRQAWYQATAEGTAAQAQKSAQLAYSSPEDVEGAIKHALPVLTLQWAEHDGLPPEEIVNRTNQFRAAVQASVMKEYISRDQGVLGLRYLETPGIREQLGKFAPEIESNLKKISYKETGELAADDAFQRSFGQDDLPNEVPSRDWAQKRLEEIVVKNEFTVEQQEAAENALARKLGRWQEGYSTDGANLLDTANGYWTRGGFDLSAVPENLKTRLENRGEWYKMVALDHSMKQAAASEVPTNQQIFNKIQFMHDIAVNPHKYDTWDATKFMSEVGYGLTRNDREEMGGLMARTQARPERWTQGLAAVLKMGEQIGSRPEYNAFPKLRDPDPKKRDPKTGNWSDAEMQVYYEFQRRVQEWLIDWHKKPHDTPEPTMEDYMPFLEETFHKGKDPNGGWWGVVSGPTTRIKAETLGTGYEPDKALPSELLRQIKLDVARRYPGQPMPSDETLSRAYIEQIGRKNPKALPLTDEQRRAKIIKFQSRGE